jgi:hypothetical protein
VVLAGTTIFLAIKLFDPLLLISTLIEALTVLILEAIKLFILNIELEDEGLTTLFVVAVVTARLAVLPVSYTHLRAHETG